MAEYIEREKAIKVVDDLDDLSVVTGGAIAINAFREKLKEIPAADVVEVVRCGDCEYVEPTRGNNKDTLPYFCTIHREKFCDLNEYCCYGRKKGG